MSIVKKPLLAYRDMTKPRWFDWTLLGLIVIPALYLFYQGDIEITALHSYDLLSIIKSGKLFSFYEIILNKALSGGYYGNSQVGFAANYNIIIYLVLSIWLLPVKVVGFLFQFIPSPAFLAIYSKHLVMLMVLASGYLLYRMGGQFGLSKARSQWLCYLFLTSPILLYGAGMFGQLDIFSIFLTLLSLHFYLDKKLWKFSAIMAIGICFKVFALFIFVPLLLLIEKRIWSLLKYGVVGMSLLLATRLLAALDPGYSPTHAEMSKIYNFLGRLFAVSYPSAKGGVLAFVFLMIVICGLCYFVQPKEDNLKYWCVFIPLAVYASFFANISWHPQWLVILCPFIALSILLVKNFKAAVIFDCGINFGYLLGLFALWPNTLNWEMINAGVLPKVFHAKLTIRNMSKWLNNSGIPFGTLSNTIFISCLLIFVVMTFYCLLLRNCKSTADSPSVLERGVVWLRAALLPGMLIMPSIVLFFWKMH